MDCASHCDAGLTENHVNPSMTSFFEEVKNHVDITQMAPSCAPWHERYNAGIYANVCATAPQIKG